MKLETGQKERLGHIVHIKDPGGQYEAMINLQQGGRLASWKHQGLEIIGDPDGSGYDSSFAAAILVPFTNRIKNGLYDFNTRNFKLPANEKGINAIHGLVYDQNFIIKSQNQENGETHIQLVYPYRKLDQGYPFLFDLELVYKFKTNGLELQLKVSNIGNEPIPITIGWHPYFNLNGSVESSINFHPETEFIVDDRGIPESQNTHTDAVNLALKDLHLDTAYRLKSEQFQFQTEVYQIDFRCSKLSNYLQLFTPANRNYIAIEPMTGVADSFNTGEGLSVIKPEQSIDLSWGLEVQLTKQ